MARGPELAIESDTLDAMVGLASVCRRLVGLMDEGADARAVGGAPERIDAVLGVHSLCATVTALLDALGALGIGEPEDEPAAPAAWSRGALR